MKTDQLSYEDALSELQGIMNELQQEQVSIDELAAKSERARQLIAYCQNKLKDINLRLEQGEGKPNP